MDTGPAFRCACFLFFFTLCFGPVAFGADSWAPAPELKALADTTGFGVRLDAFLRQPEAVRDNARRLAEMRCRSLLGKAGLADPDTSEGIGRHWVRAIFQRASFQVMTTGDELKGTLGRLRKTLDQGIAQDPGSLTLLLVRAEVESSWGNSWAALGWYRRAGALARVNRSRGLSVPRAWDLEARLGEAWTCYKLGLWEECAPLVVRGLQSQPGNRGFQLLKGLLLAETGRGAEAMSHAVRMPPFQFRQRTSNSMGMKKRPSGFANLWIKSRVLFQEGNFVGARHVLGELETEYDQWRLPYRRAYWNSVGLTMEMVDDPECHRAYDRAWMSLRHFLPVYKKTRSPLVCDLPGTTTPFYLNDSIYYLGGSPFAYVAEMMDQMGRKENDQARLARLMALDRLRIMRVQGVPEALCLAFRGRLHFRNNDIYPAMKDLEKAHTLLADQGRHDAGTSYLLGLAYLVADQNEQARTVLTEALQLEPENPDLMGHLGVALGRTGHEEQALTLLTRALSLDPGQVEFLYNRGVVHFQRREWSLAEQDLQRALQGRPGDRQIGFLLQKIRLARRESAVQSTGGG